jgi:hypothetical protein
MTMPPEEQIEKLRKSARLSWIPKGLFALTLVLIALGFQSGYEVFFVIGAFTGLATAASRKTAPHWRNAIQAIRNGTRPFYTEHGHDSSAAGQIGTGQAACHMDKNTATFKNFKNKSGNAAKPYELVFAARRK